jgi:hypothetical protein
MSSPLSYEGLRTGKPRTTESMTSITDLQNKATAGRSVDRATPDKERKTVTVAKPPATN